jgi:hypothetical protein
MTLLINFQIDVFFKRKFLIGLTSKFGNLVWPNASAALVLSVSPLFYMGFQSLNFVDILWPYTQGRSKGGGQVGPAHPRILLAHPRKKVKHIRNKIHLQYLSIICLWFKIWPTPTKNHCYALAYTLDSFTVTSVTEAYVSQITTWLDLTDLTIDLQKVRLWFFTCHLVTVTMFNWMIVSFWNIVELWHLSELFFYFWHFCFLRDGFRKNIELHNRNLLCPILFWSTTVHSTNLNKKWHWQCWCQVNG